jgi:dipeptidase
MCDTLVVPPKDARRGALLFAKNSDRERNEAQALELHPRRRGDPSASRRCTYIAVPDVAETHACLLSRPFWMWGAEIGANEHGVVIGNEAMHSHIPANRRRALTGMDLVRLGLERGASAAEAVTVITALLEAHGQGGDCGHLGRFYYHNGFIIADAREAFVLETVGRWWAVERVVQPRALSNAFSIGKGFDRLSDGLAAHAEAQGWTDADGRFDCAERLIDPVRDAVSFGRGRCARGDALLARAAGRLDPLAMMAILRDHGEEAEVNPDWRPEDTPRRTLCMHAAEGPRRSQSVGSMVSELRPGGAVHWVTGSSAPCLSFFKPVLMEAGLPPQGPTPSDQAESESRWWRHEALHRRALEDFPAVLQAIAEERDALEAGFLARIDAVLEASILNKRQAVQSCWDEADAAEERWIRALSGWPRRARRSSLQRSWTRLNQVAGFRL